MTSSRAFLSSKVPQITLYFWIIKVLSTTIGETFADWINSTLGFGLTNTSLIFIAILGVALYFQMRANTYQTFKYWAVVVLMSITGTLITDNMSDNFNIPLTFSTIFFGVILALTFYLWHREEGTLSIKEINTRRRESFYWLAILFTFAMGTATGDLIAEKVNLGYGTTLLLFVLVIVVLIGLWKSGITNPVLSFWLCYIMTRPLGAASGDLLSQAKKDGGLGLGTATTSWIYLSAILIFVVYLKVSKVDVFSAEKLNQE